MKTVSMLIIVGVLVNGIIIGTYSGCDQGQKQATAYADSLAVTRHAVDSLKIVADSSGVFKARLREQRILIREVHLSCRRYATSVENNPALSVYIVGWIDRRFKLAFPDD